MKQFNKKDLIYAIEYGLFSIFYGKLLYMEQANGYYTYFADLIEFDFMQVLMLLLWFLPKIFAMVYLVQYFIDAYDHCFMYFKIRSRNSSLWLKQVLGTTLSKLLLFSIVKGLVIYILVSDIDMISLIYETLYILFFVVLYMVLYVCIPNVKILFATACVQMLLYEIICILRLFSMQSILLMNDITIVMLIVAVVLSLCMIYVFNFVLCKQKYER